MTQALYSLEKLIEWKQVTRRVVICPFPPLYSLEKLIEWKLFNSIPSLRVDPLSTLYSLEKLIEWKRLMNILRYVQLFVNSLLAREIN